MQKTFQVTENLGRGMEKVTQTIRKQNKETGRLNNVYKTVEVRQRKFQMQWLSMLFFGMAIQRMMNGLVKTSLEWVGVTELMNTTLGVFFLPLQD